MDDVSLLRAVAPHTGKTVGLQLQIYGKRILRAFVLLGQPPHLLLDPQQLLHVMPEFMRDDIGLREVAGVAAECLSSCQNERSMYTFSSSGQ